MQALIGEFRRVGEVAGLVGPRASSGGERFSPTDPSASSGALIKTMNTNDQRNESEHAYLQVTISM